MGLETLITNFIKIGIFPKNKTFRRVGLLDMLFLFL